MTYNEWRDELKNNLLSVSEVERTRVLDYYAEAYADRREAGFTEREIIAGFGAPYDAAQRILHGDDEQDTSGAPRYGNGHGSGAEQPVMSPTVFNEQTSSQSNNAQAQSQSTTAAQTVKKSNDNSWAFVLLCVIFAIPIFVVVVVLASVTFGLCVAPFSLLGAGVAQVFAGIGIAFANITSGFVRIGLGLLQVGIGLALIPLCIWIVKQMWKLFKMFFAWVKGLFGGKEDAQ